RHRGGQQYRHRFDRFRRGFRQHAPGVVLFPGGGGAAVSRFCLLPLALLPAALQGQATGSVYGAVRDTTGHGVRSASVSITGSRLRTNTGNTGAYRLEAVPAGPITLQVQALGFQPESVVVTITANDSTRVDFTLRAVQNLAPIVVTAGKRQQSLQDVVTNLIPRDVPDDAHARIRVIGGGFAGPPHDVWKFRDYTGIEGGVDVIASWGRDPFRGAVAAGTRHSDGYRQQDQRDHWQLAGKGQYRLDPVTRLDLSGAWASDQYQVPLSW